jgi:chromosome segregation ATPase
MRTSPSKPSVPRRLAAAVVLPGLLATSFVLVQPAVAGTSSNGSICNGVVNQLTHRGTVQENLLKAAVRKNADVIAKLQAERDGLAAQEATFRVQILAADTEIAALEAEEQQLVKDVQAAEDGITRLAGEKTATEAAIAATQEALAVLHVDKAGVENGLAPLLEQQTAAEAAAAGLRTEAAALTADVAGVQLGMDTAAGELLILQQAAGKAAAAVQAKEAQIQAAGDELI